MAYRDHEAIVIEQFNGLFDRGDTDTVPLDHFSDCENIQFVHEGFTTRDGLDTYRAVAQPVRIYNYVMQAGESLLILDTEGKIWHSINETTTHGPILTIPAMTDFGFVSYAGRAYITPFKTETNALGVNYQRGLQGEHVYVYKGDGTPARKAGGAAPVGTLTLAAGGGGHVDMGIHIVGVAYETDTGFITQITGFAQVTTDGFQSIVVSNIPTAPAGSNVVARRLVSTIAIDPAIFTGDLKGYQFFYAKRIPDNTTTSFTLDFYDSELISDAGHLLDILPNIPAGVGLTVYHNRLVSYAEFDNISMLRVSYVGEPEAMDAVSGILIFPLDGNPITNAQEYRDVLYVFKKTRTAGWTDTGDVPTSWPFTWLDQGVGASVHGIANVLDSGGVNIDYLLIVDFSGLMLFNGAYARPELSWKIRDIWFNLNRNDFGNIQIMNDSLTQIVYITLPDKRMLYADYTNGLDAQNIKWSKWRFDVMTTTITLVETNKLIIGSEGPVVNPLVKRSNEITVLADPINTTPETAIEILSLPIHTQQVMQFATAGSPFLWYKYTAKEKDHVLGAFGFFTGSFTSSNISVWDSIEIENMVTSVGSNLPVQFLTIPGKTYYIRFQVFTNITNASVTLDFELYKGPDEPIPAGSILINDDEDGRPGAIFNTNGDIISFRATVPAGEEGAVAANGLILRSDDTDDKLVIMSSNMTVKTETSYFVNGLISTTRTTSGSFWIMEDTIAMTPPRPPAEVFKLDQNGVMSTVTNTMPDLFWRGAAPSTDETILYYTVLSDGGPYDPSIRRWNLTTNTAMTNLVTGAQANEVPVNRGLAVPPTSDNVVSLYTNNVIQATIVRVYGTAGALLHTYTLPWDTYGFLGYLHFGLNNESIWIWGDIDEIGYMHHVELRLSDGVVLQHVLSPVFEGGGSEFYPPTSDPEERFGTSFSCVPTVMMLPVPELFPEAAPSGIYQIKRGKTNDTVYTAVDPVATEVRKIPDPFIKTSMIGS